MQNTLPRIQPRPEFAGILREQEEFADPNDASVGGQMDGAFDKLLLQSGLGIAPMVMLLLCLCSAVTLAGVVFVIQENLLTMALGLGIGFIIPIIVVAIIRASRQSQMMGQIPEMVEELARSAKTGRSLEQCFAETARDTAAPLGDELRLCQRKVELGLPVGQALHELPDRTGLVSLRVFAMALSVHQSTGGNLVLVLDRLAQTIRDRISFLGRLRAATAASRASAILMIGIPPAVMAFFIFRDPDYFTQLMNAPWGRNLTIFAVLLQIVGAVWVLRILRNTQRT